MFIEIKCKYCSVCDRAKKYNKEPKGHIFSKKWSRKEASTIMESESIVGGFQESVKKHILIYCKLIACGDSSVFGRILEVDPYEDYKIAVEKIECSKHLLRAFKNRIKIIGKRPGRVVNFRHVVADSVVKCIAQLDAVLEHH